jgi:anti-sigma-K factor RskA
VTARLGPDHERWQDASGAYLLGAMDPAEAAGYSAHLAACPVCRTEVQELRIAVNALPLSVPQLAAPAAMEERVMAVVRREGELTPAAGDGSGRRRARPRRGWWRLPTPAIAAGALAVGIVLGLVAAGAIGGGPETIPMTATGLARGARAELVVDGGAATLRAAHLPSPGRGRVYQVWLQPASGPPRPTAALFVPRRDGQATVGVPTGVRQARAVLVTAEPDGGSPAPTSSPVLAAVTG